MKDAIYIIMERSGARRMTKSRPKLNGGQIAIRLRLEVSNKFFDRFMPEAFISIPDDVVIEPEVEVDLLEEEANEPGANTGAG